MGKGTIFVDHTTASAEIARELYAAGKKGGFDFIDAPVSGGQAGAENGVLTVMCGGEQAPFDQRREGDRRLCARLQSDRRARRRPTHQDGQPDLHRRLGARPRRRRCTSPRNRSLDIEKVIATISKGAAQSWQMENRYKTMVAGKFDYGFAVDWMRKDLSICLGEARKNGATLPVTALVDQFYAEVQTMGGKRWDTSSLLARLER